MTVDIAEYLFFAIVPEIRACGIHLLAHVTIRPCAIFNNGKYLAIGCVRQKVIVTYFYISFITFRPLYSAVFVAPNSIRDFLRLFM